MWRVRRCQGRGFRINVYRLNVMGSILMGGDLGNQATQDEKVGIDSEFSSSLHGFYQY